MIESLLVIKQNLFAAGFQLLGRPSSKAAFICTFDTDNCPPIRSAVDLHRGRTHRQRISDDMNLVAVMRVSMMNLKNMRSKHI